jgi:hypothetical protein
LRILQIDVVEGFGVSGYFAGQIIKSLTRGLFAGKMKVGSIVMKRRCYVYGQLLMPFGCGLLAWTLLIAYLVGIY